MLGALSRTDIVRHASPLLSSTFAGCSDATVARLAINIVEGHQLWKRPRVQSLRHIRTVWRVSESVYTCES
jgi:hypothetical protein